MISYIEEALSSLEKDDKELVKKILNESNYTNEEYFWFWGWDDIQFDGNFTLNDLKTWVKVMQALEDKHK